MPVILLFGMPRSGTTWIGKIFDSHSKTLYRHEPDTWKKISSIPLLEGISSAEQHCEVINDYVNDFVLSRRVEVNGKLPFFRKDYASFMRHNLFRSSVLFSNMLAKINNNVRFPVIRPYGDLNKDNPVVVWKSIQLLGRMGVINHCLDDCKCIQILRHPCGYIASVLGGEQKQKFSSQTPASEDYDLYEMLLNTKLAQSYELTMQYIKQLEPEERLAWRWVLFNEKALNDNKIYNNTMLLKYEDMCLEPTKIAKACFEFCGLEWCQQTEDFLKVSTENDNESYYSVYKNPEVAANKWKEKLTTKQIDQIKNIVGQSNLAHLYQC